MTNEGEAVDNQERIPDEEAVAPADGEPACSADPEPAGGAPNTAAGRVLRPNDLSGVQTAVVSVWVDGIRRLVSAGTTVVQHVASSPPARFVGDIAGGISTALAEDSGIDWRGAGERTETEVGRLFAVVIPLVIDSIDIADVIDRVDVNALIAKVDIDAVLNRVDLNKIVDTVDLDAQFARVNLDELIERIDIDAVLDRVDLNKIVDTVDLDAQFARVNLDELIERIDIDAVLDRVDVAKISERIRVWNMLAKSSGAVASSAVDRAREHGAGLDEFLGNTFDRVRRQDPDDLPGPAQLDSDGEEGAT